MRMAAQYELLKELLNSGTKLSFGQEFFFKFYQAFILKDRWTQYIKGVSTTLLVTAIALALGIVLGSVVALVRVAHDQQRPGHKNPVLGFFNIICEIYTTIIRGTPMMVQLLIMSMVIFANSRNFTMVGALALGINSGAYVSEIIRGGLMVMGCTMTTLPFQPVASLPISKKRSTKARRKLPSPNCRTFSGASLGST